MGRVGGKPSDAFWRLIILDEDEDNKENGEKGLVRAGSECCLILQALISQPEDRLVMGHETGPSGLPEGFLPACSSKSLPSNSTSPVVNEGYPEPWGGFFFFF